MMLKHKGRTLVASATCMMVLLGTVGIGVAARPLVVLLPGEPALLVGQLSDEGLEETAFWQIEVDASDMSGFEGIVEFEHPEGGGFLGRVSGSVKWGEITGVLTSDEGKTFGVLSGTISVDGVGGEYLLVDGRRGAWSYPLNSQSADCGSGCQAF